MILSLELLLYKYIRDTNNGTVRVNLQQGSVLKPRHEIATRNREFNFAEHCLPGRILCHRSPHVRTKYTRHIATFPQAANVTTSISEKTHITEVGLSTVRNSICKAVDYNCEKVEKLLGLVG